MTFNHLCGRNSSSGINCSVSVSAFESNFSSSVDLFSMESDEDNATFLASATDWSFERLSLPAVKKGTRLKLNTLFDWEYGAVGTDNFRITTPQK